MLIFGRSRNAKLLPRIALLALGPVAFGGCGSDDEATQSVENAPAAAAPAGHDVASAHAGGHGAHGAAHGAPAHGAAGDAHAMHGAPAGAHGHDVAAAHGSSSNAHSSAAGAHGAPAAHGTPGGAAVAAHGAPAVHSDGSSAGAPSSHDPAAQHAAASPMPHGIPSGVPTSHDAGGVATSGGPAAHSGAAGSPAAHGVPVASGDSSSAGGHGQSAVPGPGAVDSSGAPAGHGQMTPGVGGVPEGYAGSDIPGAAAPQQKFEEGTAEYAVQQLVMKMQAGNTEELDKLISEKTKDPILQPLLEGKADEEQIQKNKELVAGAMLKSHRESGSSKLFVVNNAEGKVLTFTARKDGEAFKVVNIRVETPRGLKSRQQQTGS